MKIGLLLLACLSAIFAISMLIMFSFYFISEWQFLHSCTKTKGQIIRWVTTSKNTDSFKQSWWFKGDSWSPVINYYDVSLGTYQEHEAILPRHCKLHSRLKVREVEIQYANKFIRVCDQRFVNNNIYSGVNFFYLLIFSIALFTVSLAMFLTA